MVDNNIKLALEKDLERWSQELFECRKRCRVLRDFIRSAEILLDKPDSRTTCRAEILRYATAHGAFIVRDLEDSIDYEIMTIRSAVSRLVKDGRLMIHETGSGRRPSKYKLRGGSGE